jgi:hypothetical protein
VNSYVDRDSSSDVAPQGRRLIYFSSVTYASYAQRPHFMAAAFADDRFDSVLWVDPNLTRLPTIADLKRGRPKNVTMERNDDARIKVFRATALPVEPLPMSGFANHIIAWRTICAQLLEFAGETDHCVLGIGYGHHPQAKGFGFIADLGVAYGIPEVSYTLSPTLIQRAGPAMSQQIESEGLNELKSKVSPYRCIPCANRRVVSLLAR